MKRKRRNWKNAAYTKRFSERWMLWVLCAAAFIAMIVSIYLKIVRAAGSGVLSIFWIVVNFAMMAMIFVARRTRGIHSRRGRRWADRISGIWLFFVVISFILVTLFVSAEDITGHHVTTLANCIIASFILSAAALALGVRQAATVQVTHLELPTPKLPEGEDRLRIVQLTDLHLGPWAGMSMLVQIIRKVRAAKPDIVVITGDLADGKLSGREREISLLRHIKAKYGVYAVTGNHDYYDGIEDSVHFMESAGIKVLRTEGVEAGGIIIAGADDRDHLIKARWGLTRSEVLVLSYEQAQKEKFLLLLRHRPIVELGTEGHFDLQLSGHTHGGQIVPLISSRLKIAKHPRGFKKLKCGAMLYVSNGAGYVGPPVRMFAPPEILVLDLERNTKDEKNGASGEV
jgi:predicted MPP superfamily phosphohydrolase